MTEFAQSMTIRSCDNVTFNVNLDAAKISGLINKSLEDDDEDSNPEIQTPRVNSTTLKKIVDFMILNKANAITSIKKSIPGPDFRTIVVAENTEEYMNFFADYDEATPEKMDQLYDLMFAADFMEIQTLLELTSAKLGCLAKSNPDQLMKLLVGNATRA